ncbi:MAG: hypothetical protein ABI237_00575 [Ginsengibacter sp.]
MNIFRLIAEFFLFYLLYKLIFDFIVPIYKSTKKIRKQFGEMQEKTQNDTHTYQGHQNPSQPAPAAKKEGDYIEFEEIQTP